MVFTQNSSTLSKSTIIPPISPPSSTAQANLDSYLASTERPKERHGREVPDCWVPQAQQPLRHARKLRVVTIGGGVSAMNMAYEIIWGYENLGKEGREEENGEKKRGGLDDVVEHVIYEKEDVLGGTWWVNRYPGVACDVPAHIYTFPFEPNPDWTSFYASGPEIHAYFLRTVRKYNLDRDVKLSHEIVGAEFDDYEGIWNLRVRHIPSNTVFSDWCNILIKATGFLSTWSYPSIPGLSSFSGALMHSAAWDPAFDAKGKSVAVIGNGSTGIQLLPEVAKTAKQVVNFIREPTWITPGLGSAVIGGKVNWVYGEDEKREFADKEGKLREYRREIQAKSNRGFDVFEKDSPAQKAALESTTQLMLDRLNGNKELAAKMIPDWEVGCRRATPGPGYLEAFSLSHVSLTDSPITNITPSGIMTKDGNHHAVDAIICATGFDVSHRPPFPLIGLNNTDLREYWKDEPLSYLSLACPHFPNLFFFSGPNAPVGHGSLMAALSWIAQYISQWIRKISSEDIKYVFPSVSATEEFNTYGDEIMERFVWSGGCKSWYKGGRKDGRVTAIWPGSAMGFKEVVGSLRPEDFEIKYRSGNRFRWMGSGRSRLEGLEGLDLGFYLVK